MKEDKYICFFEYQGVKRNVESVGGISDFRDGFWINAHFDLARISDCAHWIPPGRIYYISKVSTSPSGETK